MNAAFHSAAEFAIAERNFEIAHYLIHESGAVQPERENIDSALQLSALWGDVELIRYWIGHGADVNAVGIDRATPVNLAVRSGHLDAVRELVAHGARLDIVSGFVWNGMYTNGPPLSLASAWSTPEMVALLLELGVGPGRTRRCGWR